MNLQPIPSEQIKTGFIHHYKLISLTQIPFIFAEKGHKKAREEEMRAIKSKVMSLPTTPSNPTYVHGICFVSYSVFKFDLLSVTL